MKQELREQAFPILNEFIAYLNTIKGKSPRTVEEYFLDLRTFFRYLKKSRRLVPDEMDFQEIPIADIDLDFLRSITVTEIYEYMNYLSLERHNQPASRSRKVSSLRTFFHYLTKKTQKLSFNPVEELETPKQRKSLPRYLSLEQSIELLNHIDGPYQERDYCIIVLFLNCGMRLSELVGLNLSDVRSGSRSIRILGKGNKERMVYLNDACVDAIQRYLEVRPHDGLLDKNALFISRQKKRISPKTVQYLVKKYLSSIQLDEGYSVHKLRHTAATLMYQYGNVDIRVLKDILGHENLGTTEIYTHLSSKQMEEAAKANPLSRVHPRKNRAENGGSAS